MNLFFEGNLGVGKSFLLWEALGAYASAVKGFCVQRLYENGERIGFRAVCLERGFPTPEIAYVPGMEGVFILREHYEVVPLEEAILRVESDARAPCCKLVLLDEIGGIELTSRVFMDALKRVLSGGVPCVGVFKSRENLIHASSVLGLGAEYPALHRELEALIRKRGELITVTDKNRVDVHRRLQSYISDNS